MIVTRRNVSESEKFQAKTRFIDPVVKESPEKIGLITSFKAIKVTERSSVMSSTRDLD